jgi:heat shock protein HslJ
MLRALTTAAICIASMMLLTSCTTGGGADIATPAVAASQSPEAAGTAFRATGNEPSWRLDIGGTELTLLTNFGQDRLVAATPTARVAGGTTTYVAGTPQGELTVTIVNQLCVDSMSGMPHPRSVTVGVGGRTLTGCGGEPASLLQGAEWAVVQIGGAPIVDGSKVTLEFAADGRVAGHASCNRFTSAYALSGEGLTISKSAVTKMMCDAALMAQERRFLDALDGVRNFSVAADGALLLNTGDGRTILARRR